MNYHIYLINPACGSCARKLLKYKWVALQNPRRDSEASETAVRLGKDVGVGVKGSTYQGVIDDAKLGKLNAGGEVFVL